VATILVLHRSNDGSAITARIGDALAAHYGKAMVDVAACDGAAPKADSRGVVVAIVGPRWLGPVINGRSGVHEALDPIRQCLEAALHSGAAVVPVTVGGSRLPRAAELPDSLKGLALRPAIEVDFGRNFSAQTAQLIAAIDRELPAHAPDRVEAAGATVPRAAEPVGTIAGAATVAAPALQPTIAAPPDDRATPEYWMRNVDIERGLSPGDAPLIMVSYANEDLEWVSDLQAFIDPKLENLRDPGGQAYRLWQFSDAQSGTALGDEFPSIIAETMWRCRVAIVVLSKAYFTSRFCRQIELPFLMWRRERHGLFCVPLRLGALPTDRVRLPAHAGTSRHVFIDAIVDDRQAPADFATSPHRDLSLRQLREKGLESEIESRFDGIARLIVDFLRKQHDAVDE